MHFYTAEPHYPVPMEHQRFVLPLLVVALVLVTGCIQNNTAANTPPKTLEITTPECTAASRPCTNVRKGEPVRIQWDVKYNDPNPITIPLNEGNEPLGFAVLQNFCTIFDTEQSTFTATRISPFDREDVSTADAVTLQNQETLRFEWVFHLRDTDISELGAGCNPRFKLRYTHTVNGSKQVQVRAHRQVEEATGLSQNLESPTPVKLRIESPTSFIAGDPFFTEVYLENRGGGDLVHIDHVNASFTRGIVGEPVHPDAAPCGIVNPANRNENMFVITTGPRSGETSRLECGPEHGFRVSSDALQGQSNTYLITATGTYTYEEDVGGVRVEVAPSE